MFETEARAPEAAVDPLFIERWSPRAFLPVPLTAEEIASLFEAARWAPSSSNSQPWLFLYATDGPEREVFNSILNEGNRKWAPRAPLLIYVVARRNRDDGQPMRTAQFDTGAAWMSLALQARMLGLYAHAMGGIDLDAAYEKLRVPRDDYEVICAVAVGRRGDAIDLPEDRRGQEFPKGRKPLAEVAREGFL
jgi:nitroreductase